MTITEQKLELTKDAIGNVLEHHRASYVNGMAIRNLLAEREPGFMVNLNVHGTPQPLNIPNCTSHVYTYLQTQHARDFLGIRAAHEISEKNPDFLEAFAILDPLVSEYRRLQGEIATERLVAAEASNKLQEAVEAARLAAEEKLAKDPAVLAAQKAFEAAQPALVPEPTPDIVLTRGKMKLEAVPS
jgi:hypothetical protein